MTVLIGHPSGTPFAFNAALSHCEAGRLGAFCIPWMPSLLALRLLASIKPLVPLVERLRRRNFPPLPRQLLVQGRAAEWRRLLLRAVGCGDERLVVEANQWVMRTMARECRRPGITAVHAYEDCSLWQFQEARRLGKPCIYDLPIGYYAAWQEVQRKLASEYVDWVRPGALLGRADLRTKQLELSLADVILVPSRFVADTVRQFHPDAPVRIAPYGVDPVLSEEPPQRQERITFVFVGQCSIRKGVPLLLKAWRAADVAGATHSPMARSQSF